MKKNFLNIAEFIDYLDKIGELKRIKEEVSPIIEISKYTDIESKAEGGGKALLFENVIDNGKKSFPVATNLFGSQKRMAIALGLENLDDAGKEIQELLNTQPPASLTDKIKMLFKLMPLAKVTPKMVKNAPCQELIFTGEDIDLSEIPVLKCWPHDGGRFVTFPLVFTKSPVDNRRNLGMYRLQIFDKNTTGMHWHIHKDASHYYNEYVQRGERMPVAVAIGADPSIIYAATAPMPRGIDEILLAGFFRKEGVEMVKCKTIDLEVPANAEFVLEGYVEPAERRLEGPFGDHTGYYSLADMYPVFHLTAITRKRNPIYCATLVGPPPMEDCYMAKATERIFLPLLRTVLPEIKDYFLPWEGVFHNIVIVSIDKEYPAHAQRLMSALWGQGQMSFCKAIVVVDKDVNPSDLNKVWDLLINNFDPQNDITISYGVLDVLDHSSPKAYAGAKIGIDLTTRIQGEDARNINKLECISKETQNDMKKWIFENIDDVFDIVFNNGSVAISIDKTNRSGKEILNKLLQYTQLHKYARSVCLFDKEVNIHNVSKKMWKLFNNTDPSRDIIIEKSLILIDACKKNKADGHQREWPDDLSFDK